MLIVHIDVSDTVLHHETHIELHQMLLVVLFFSIVFWSVNLRSPFDWRYSSVYRVVPLRAHDLLRSNLWNDPLSH